MRLFNGDCLNELQHLPDASIDLIIADPPYGVTKCEWDKVIPFKRLWKELHRVAKDSAAIVIFGDGLFMADLIDSNRAYYRYDWVWAKPHATGFLNANRRPLRAHEHMFIFYRKQPIFNPQKTDGHTRKVSSRNSLNSKLYGKAEKAVKYDSTERYPRSVLFFSSDKQTNALHPTQKPIELLQYLIKTFSNPGDTVLDFAMGSGSTGAAALMLDRDFVGIEQDYHFFKTAEKWLNSICKLAL